jgi:uncharacterized membrane protein YeiH
MLDFGATFFAALSGAFVAVRRGYDIVGIFFIAALTALGGAVLRDDIMLLCGPSVVITEPNYLVIVLFATIAGVLLRSRLAKLGRIVSVADAVALAAYAMLGVTKALAAGLPATGAILTGVLNAVGGGILRDICAGEAPMIFRPGEFYALVAFLGTTLYTVLAPWEIMTVPQTAYLCLFIMLTLRLLTIAYHWRTKAFAALETEKNISAQDTTQEGDAKTRH